jgi:hypothetical protein
VGKLSVLFLVGVYTAATFAIGVWPTIPRLVRVRLYIAGLISVAIALLGLWVGERISRDTFIEAMLVTLLVQLVLGSLLIAVYQARCLGDPDRRAKDGLAQYDGKSKLQWNLLLIFSPFHVIRYYKHMKRDLSVTEAGAADYRDLTL